MSSKKEEKAQAAAEKIKAQALSAAKGLSRAQAERAATAAARNVNAYGQKEEGPSRWQERKEAKRQMYLMSTEKAVRLGERKDQKASSSAAGAGASQCQKCLQPGHWTYECKNERVYITRPSRSQQLKNPGRTKLVVSFEGNSDVQRRLEQDEKAEMEKSSKENSRKNSKRKHRSKSYSESDTSEATVFESGSSSQSDSESDYSSEETSSSYSSSDSGYRRRSRKKKPRKKRRHRRYTSSSSDFSESDSATDSDSDSDRDSRRKARRNGKRR